MFKPKIYQKAFEWEGLWSIGHVLGEVDERETTFDDPSPDEDSDVSDVDDRSDERIVLTDQVGAESRSRARASGDRRRGSAGQVVHGRWKHLVSSIKEENVDFR